MKGRVKNNGRKSKESWKKIRIAEGRLRIVERRVKNYGREN